MLEARLDGVPQLFRGRERIQHLALHRWRKKLLLIVLPVNIAEKRRELAEQRYGRGPVSHQRPGFPIGLDLALHQQFVILKFDSGLFQ